MPATFVATANPYPWPYDGDLHPANTALVIIDMQTDFCGPGGYVDLMGYDIGPARACIAPIQRVLAAMRDRGYHVIHTREGHRPDLSDLTIDFWRVLVPAVGALGLCVGFLVLAVGRVVRRAQTAGVEELIGMIGIAQTRLDPSGTVLMRGEYWRADAEEPIEANERVETLGLEGLRLRVRRAPRRG